MSITGFDGTPLAVHRLGSGRPLILLHGLFSSAAINWIKYGHAALLAEAGFDVIMPDLRAHGQSAAPRGASAYPRDVLVRDLSALVAQLGLTDYDLGGFSLGARTAVAGVAAGLRPRRLVLGGMGLEGLTGWARRSAHFSDAIARFGTIPPGDPAYLAQQFMRTMKIDRVAAQLLLDSVADVPAETLGAATMPCLVVCGADDRDNGDPAALAAALPLGQHVAIPGTHMSCVTKPELGAAIRDFLRD